VLPEIKFENLYYFTAIDMQTDFSINRDIHSELFITLLTTTTFDIRKKSVNPFIGDKTSATVLSFRII